MRGAPSDSENPPEIDSHRIGSLSWMDSALPPIPAMPALRPPRLGGPVIIVAVLVLVAGCSHGGGDGKGAEAEAELPRLEAEVLTIEPRSWPFKVRSQGNVIADESAVIGTRVAGRVRDVFVDLGDRVGVGDKLVQLDEAEFRVEVELAEAALVQARSAVGLREGDPVSGLDPLNSPPVREQKAVWDEARSAHDRGRQLTESGSITVSVLERLAAADEVAEARYNSALNAVREKLALIEVREAELALARQRLEDAVVVAPFDGQVEVRHVAPGSYVEVGREIVTIVRTNPLRFRGTIPERHARHLAIGQNVRLRIESMIDPHEALVTRISPAVDVLSRGLMFEARVENAVGAIRAGLFAEAEIVLDPAATSLIVPRSAVTEFAGAEKVWRVVDGQSEEVVVLTGQRRGDRIEILEGLAAGDTILVDGGSGRVARIDPIEVSEPDSEVVVERRASDDPPADESGD